LGKIKRRMRRNRVLFVSRSKKELETLGELIEKRFNLESYSVDNVVEAIEQLYLHNKLYCCVYIHDWNLNQGCGGRSYRYLEEAKTTVDIVRNARVRKIPVIASEMDIYLNESGREDIIVVQKNPLIKEILDAINRVINVKDLSPL